MGHAMSLPENSQIIRILAADRTAMNSQLLADALARDNKFFVVDSATSSSNVLSAIAKERPHVAVLSAQLDGDQQSGYELTKALRADHPEIRVVLLLDSSDCEAVVKAFRAGARGVFSRTGSFETLAKCIRCVYQGQVWANRYELNFLLEALSETGAFSFPETIAMSCLSKREQDVVRSVVEGLNEINRPCNQVLVTNRRSQNGATPAPERCRSHWFQERFQIPSIPRALTLPSQEENKNKR